MLYVVVINCLSWNVRGLGGQTKISEVRSWITEKNLDWVGHTKTKTIRCSNVLPSFRNAILAILNF